MKQSRSPIKRYFPVNLPLRAAALIVLLGCVGCKSDSTIVPVKGVVTRNGQPVKFVFLTFCPEEEGVASRGMTDAEGRFELNYDKDTKGARVGKHKVVAVFRPRNPAEEMDFASGKIKLHPDQNAITEKYGKRETTALTVEITGPRNDLELKLD